MAVDIFCFYNFRFLLTVKKRFRLPHTESKTEKVQRRFGRDLCPKLYRPIGLTQRLDGSFVTADVRTNRVYVYDRHGLLSRDFAIVHQYVLHQGLAVTLSDQIVLPCTAAGRSLLAYYTPDGSYVGCTFLPVDTHVSGIAVNSQNKMLVADVTNRCVHVLHERRRVLRSFQLPSAPGETEPPVPQGVCTAVDDQIVVTDSANHCVKVLDSEGKLRAQFGTRGSRPGQFERPMGVCVDSRGRFLVADSDNYRVQLFDRHGRFLHFVVR